MEKKLINIAMLATVSILVIVALSIASQYVMEIFEIISFNKQKKENEMYRRVYNDIIKNNPSERPERKEKVEVKE